MYTANLPRYAAMRANLWPLDSSKDWLISISDLYTPPVDIPDGKFERILFSIFCDTSDEDIRCGGITDEQAQEIADFIKEARIEQKNIWANCHAGISRSGAIVTVLLDLGWEFQETGLSPVRIPNTLVYKKVAKHFEELNQSWS